MTLPDRFEVVNKKVVIFTTVNNRNRPRDEPPINEDYLESNEGWGYVHLADNTDVVYFALYVGHPDQKIKYFGIIDRIISPVDTLSPVKKRKDAREAAGKGKKYIVLKEGTLVKMQHPIPLGTHRTRMQGTKIVDLQTFINAETIDDL